MYVYSDITQSESLRLLCLLYATNSATARLADTTAINGQMTVIISMMPQSGRCFVLGSPIYHMLTSREGTIPPIHMLMITTAKYDMLTF